MMPAHQENTERETLGAEGADVLIPLFRKLKQDIKASP